MQKLVVNKVLAQFSYRWLDTSGRSLLFDFDRQEVLGYVYKQDKHWCFYLTAFSDPQGKYHTKYIPLPKTRTSAKGRLVKELRLCVEEGNFRKEKQV